MPSDPEIIKLKKEIHHLKEHIALLSEQNRDYSLKIGSLETELINSKNKSMLVSEYKIAQSKENIRNNVELVLMQEKEKMLKILEENKQLKEELQLKQKMLENNEIFIKNLQGENNTYKKQLIEFGKKHNADDFVSEIKTKDDLILKKEEDYQKIVLQWNQLKNQAEEVLAENRVLRQIADVPENFGIQISEVRMGDALKIEDYKAKIRILKKEVDDLETERAQLKHRLTYMANLMEMADKDPNGIFKDLTKEQKVEVVRYAQCLYEGKEPIIPERYDLLREVERLKSKIEMLQGRGGVDNINISKQYQVDNNIFQELRNENAELKQLLSDNLAKMNMADMGGNRPGNNMAPYKLFTRTNYSRQPTLNNNNESGNKGNNYYITVTGDNNNNNNNKNAGGMYNTYGGGNFMRTSGNMYPINTDGYQCFSFMQLPPVPLVDQQNINNTKNAASYRFNTSIQIPTNQIYQLFGIANDDSDPEQLKTALFSLQGQILELLEIESRRDKNDRSLNENLKNIYNKYEDLILVQKEVIERYIKERQKNKVDVERYTKTNEDLLSQLENYRRQNKTYEQSLSLLEKRNLNEIERKYIEKMKEASILDGNNIKLTRQYKCLIEEERKLRDYVEQNETFNLEKDKQFLDTIAKLKAWKNLLLYYVKLLNNKLKRAVDKNEFIKVVDENKYLRKQNDEMNQRELSVLKLTTMAQTLRIKYRQLENDYFDMEEMKLDAQIELNILKKKVQQNDPSYHLEQRAFRKLTQKLNELKKGYNEIVSMFTNQGSNNNINNSSLYNSNNNMNNMNNDNRSNYDNRSINQSQNINPNTSNNLNNNNNNNQLNQSNASFNNNNNNSNINNSQIHKQNPLGVLTVNNLQITKDEFQQGLYKLGISTSYLTQADLRLIYQYLNCEQENSIDLRLLLKKIEQVDIEIANGMSEDYDLLQRLIDCVRTSGRSLLSTFEFFDCNNNGCITRQEFKFALQRLNFQFTEETLSKLVILVSGEERANSKLNKNDTFNYIEFCELFEEKAKNFELKNKKISQNKKLFNIDWKTNALTSIVTSLDRANISIDQAFDFLDKTKPGHLTFEEFSQFINGLEVILTNEDIKNLYKSFDTGNINFVLIDVLKSALNNSKTLIDEYNKMTRDASAKYDKIDLSKKYHILLEEKHLFEHKKKLLERRIEELEKLNADLNNDIISFSERNTKITDKYFKELHDLEEIKNKYVSLGVKKEDIQKLEDQNDRYEREVTVLRIGLNTFKELYNSSNFQAKQLTLDKEKHKDELDTYKRAIRELQGETNQNALIGRLYYTILISRWREANTLRKYDDFVNDFSTMKEENFRLETQNKTLTKDLCDIQVTLHEKMIENIRMADEIENYESGIVMFDSNKNAQHPIEELKKLVRLLSGEKMEYIEKIIKLKKEILKCDLKNENLANKINFANSLIDKIRFDNQDEFSKKLLLMCEEISQLKLGCNQSARENLYLKENEIFLNKIKESLTLNLKNLEVSNAEWENKYRKMEEIYRVKDLTRQNKIYDALEKLKMYDSSEMDSILKGGDGPQKNRIISNNPKNRIPNEEYEKKINELNNVINIKNNEIQRLSQINNENAQIIQQGKDFYNENNLQNLVGQSGYELIKDDETKMIAQTAHKTIKTLQDLLSQKNSIINTKDNEIDRLQSQLRQLKESSNLRIGALEDQIKNDHDSTMKKLGDIIDMNNPNLVLKKTSYDLKLLSLPELEKLINEKDNAITSYAREIKVLKEENQKNYIVLNEKNKQIAEMQDEFEKKNILNKYENNNEDIEQLKKLIQEKTKLIDYQKEKIDELKRDFSKQYQEKNFLDNAQLDNTVNVPERLVVNKEKSDLYVKIEQQRKKCRKLQEEKEKIEQEKGKIIKEKENLEIKISKTQEQSKKLLDFQKTDLQRINKLKSEKEKLISENKKLNEEIEKLKNRLNNVLKNNSSNNINNVPPKKTGLNQPQNSNILEKKEPSSSLIKNESELLKSNTMQMPNIIQSQIKEDEKSSLIKQSEIPMPKESQKIGTISTSMKKESSSKIGNDKDVKTESSVLQKLIFSCLKKNINLESQLKKFNTSRSGKLDVENFKNSLNSLKIGLTEGDLNILSNMTHPIDNIISIEEFINMVKINNQTYKNFLEADAQNELLNESRQTSKKYNAFQDKTYNLNY